MAMGSVLRNARATLATAPPPLILAALYAVLIVMGAAVLMLPVSHTVAITWSDALFTSTSAVTVTGQRLSDNVRTRISRGKYQVRDWRDITNIC